MNFAAVNNEMTENGTEILFLQISQIGQNPLQPRMIKNNQKLIALSESIKTYGVLEPVLVSKRDDKFTLIAGHRRLAASQLAGLEKIPVRILSYDMFDYLGTAITENMLREELNPFEVAIALGKLAETGVNRNELCVITGLASSSVTELLQLNKIPDCIRRECIKNGDTKKRFLINLSRFGEDYEIYEAYKYYINHKQLPQRKKRDYSTDSHIEKSLIHLRQLNQSLQLAAFIDYSGETKLNESFRACVVDLIKMLQKNGWFISTKFDASNSS